MAEKHILAHFMTLFEGNSNGFGQHRYNETKRKWESWSEKRRATIDNFTRHLGGEVGLGITPIRASNDCVFAAIDYDAHHGDAGEKIDLPELSMRVKEAGIPLIVCRSKGGGAHLYVFFADPIPASNARKLLTMWATMLHILETSEIFPKQHQIQHESMGNALSLPYFNCMRTERYAVVDGYELDFSKFLSTVENKLLTKQDVQSILGGEHSEAPPCIQHMIDHGSSLTNRNEAMYNMTIYMRRRFPEGYRDKLYDLNSVVFNRPLPFSEVRRTITSASRKDYRYRCNMSPCKDFCVRDTCITRRYGINADDIADNMPHFTRLRKHMTDPVQWEITCNGGTMLISTQVLMDFRRLSEVIADKLTTLVPAMKNEEWHRILKDLMEEAEVLEAPSDATEKGLFQFKLKEFLRRARLPASGMYETKPDRTPLLRGMPVAENTHDGRLIVHFRGMDFMEFLKRTRTTEARAATVWTSLQKMGVNHGRIRIGTTVVNVWSSEAETDDNEQVVPHFANDF